MGIGWRHAEHLLKGVWIFFFLSFVSRGIGILENEAGKPRVKRGKRRGRGGGHIELHDTLLVGSNSI